MAAAWAALAGSRFESSSVPDVMRFKYAKLVTNLGNGVQAICGVADSDGNRQLEKLPQPVDRYLLEPRGERR